MIVIRVLAKVKPGEKASFVTHMQQEMVEVKQFAGCEQFGLFADIGDENKFLLYEEWQSQADFDAYKNSDYFKQNSEKLFPMMVDSPDSAYFDAAFMEQA